MQKLNKLTDDMLVAAYAEGDNKAFDALLMRHQSRVFSYICTIVKNRDIADDIFQETFIKAITTIRQGRYSETGKFTSWITRIAHNLIIDFYRQDKSDTTVSSDDEPALFPRHVVQGNSRGNRSEHQHRPGPHALRPD